MHKDINKFLEKHGQSEIFEHEYLLDIFNRIVYCINKEVEEMRKIKEDIEKIARG